jgi:hypothetical protein
MITAREKLTEQIRTVVEDETGLQLVTSPGRIAARGGFETTHMYAQQHNATALSIHVAWYYDSASLTLTGPAVDRTDPAWWDAREVRGLYLTHRDGTGRPEGRVLVSYSKGEVIDGTLAALSGLLSPWRSDTQSGETEEAGQ